MSSHNLYFSGENKKKYFSSYFLYLEPRGSLELTVTSYERLRYIYEIVAP